MSRSRIAVVAATFLLASTIAVATGAPSQGWTHAPRRIAGIDRYQTSVDLSNAAFPKGAPAAVVVSGEAFPDGLAAGPYAALLGGPVLLSTTSAVPETVLTELVRLAPTRIVVVGGEAAIAGEVLDAISTRTGVVPERIAGTDRYATSAAIATRFPTGLAAAYVAGGADFPDALAAGAVAAAGKSPLLLAGSEHVPPAVRAALDVLKPGELRVVGGVASISSEAEAEVRAQAPSERRFAGTDRYGTARSLLPLWSDPGVGPPTEVLLATGWSFPDALAAAPLAALRRTPILLVTMPCAPQPTIDGMRGLAWPDVIAIGGTSVVSATAASVTPCSPVPDGFIAPGVLLSTAVLPGPRVVHLITVDRRQGYDLRSVTTTGRVNGLFPTSWVGRRTGALVAVNGDFFDPKGEPTHALVSNGRILRWPGVVDTLVGFDPARPTYGFFGKPVGSVGLDLGAGGTLPISLVNTGAPTGEQLALVTTEWTRAFPDGDWCWVTLPRAGTPSIAADESTVQPATVGAASCGAAPPRAEDVLVAPHGSAVGEQLAGLAAGQSASVRWRLHPTSHGVLDAIGANVTLVHGGRVATDILNNRGDFFNRSEARTAIGQRTDSTVVIAIVDKRPGWSLGMTPRQLADYLVNFGMIDAANLDGGGSATLAVQGVLANRPSDGGERSVNSSLVIVPHGQVLSP